MNNIRRVYIGLPSHLADVVFWVEREGRRNPLSHVEGGSDIVVEFRNGEVRGYDWIKSAYAYISALPDGIDDIILVYARKYHDRESYDTVAFKEVWNARTSEDPLLPTLRRFDQELP
jgi:hypothetical protein